MDATENQLRPQINFGNGSCVNPTRIVNGDYAMVKQN
jgi:hypothetical protein